jgi:hypothetical protein
MNEKDIKNVNRIEGKTTGELSIYHPVNIDIETN